MTDTAVQTEESKRTRFSGDPGITFGEDEFVEESTIGQRAPRYDPTPYENALKQNVQKNRNAPEGKKVAWTFTVKTDAVSVAKSRVGAAAKEVKVGVSWNTEDLGNGFTKVRVVTGKRAVGRGRKPGTASHNGPQSKK